MSFQGGLFDDPDPQRYALPQSELTLWRHFLAPEDASSMFQCFMDELQWEQSVIKVYDRLVSIPRLNAWYADEGCDYRYSGMALQRHDWQPLLLRLKERVESHTGERFNSVLANCYRDGEDSVGWHSDDEPELGRNPVIASVSLGVPRRFLLKHRGNQALRQELLLSDGSLLLMAGETQHFWYHSIPKARRVNQARINLTFRKIL